MLQDLWFVELIESGCREASGDGVDAEGLFLQDAVAEGGAERWSEQERPVVDDEELPSGEMSELLSKSVPARSRRSLTMARTLTIPTAISADSTMREAT